MHLTSTLPRSIPSLVVLPFIRSVGLIVRSQDLPPVFVADSLMLWSADDYDVDRGVKNLHHR